MIAIVDCGLGNVGSVQNMLKRLGFKSKVTSDAGEVAAATKLILPGVGAFDSGMTRLRASGLIPAIEEKVGRSRTPILGICLGMQLLGRRSEEGTASGLGWIDAEAVRFSFSTPGLRVPNMGWNTVRTARKTGLMAGLESGARFYFVHSYYLKCAAPEDVVLSSTYGHEFACGIERGNVLGVQFHPEKSHAFGMRLLRNFAENY